MEEAILEGMTEMDNKEVIIEVVTRIEVEEEGEEEEVDKNDF